MNKEPILKIKGMSKSFGITHAVVDLSLDFRAGEIHTIIGENGSGKSTLASMLAGSYLPDSGDMTLLGKTYKPATSIDGRKAHVCMLLQERGTIERMSVAENVFLGRYDEVMKCGLVNRRLMEQKTETILKKIDAGYISPKQLVDQVPFEDAKLIEVGMALMNEPEVLILDETTTALSQRGRDTVYRIARELRDNGKCVILISHDFDEVLLMSDRVSVMRDGRLIRTLEQDELNVELMRSLLIGREFSGEYYRSDTEPNYSEELVLKVEGLTCGTLVKDVSLELHKGEILGIGGLTDCGMHELLKAIFALTVPDKGTTYLPQTNVYVDSISTAVRNGVGYLPKDREHEGLMMGGSVRENITLMCGDKLERFGFISDGSEIAVANEQVEKLSIKLASINQPISDLSGGNKQKVVIAKCYANDVEIWLMDSPTRGIDVGVKAAIYRLLEKFKKERKSMIIVSEELLELIGMSDRVLVMKNGAISHEFMRSAQLSEQDIIQFMI